MIEIENEKGDIHDEKMINEEIENDQGKEVQSY